MIGENLQETQPLNQSESRAVPAALGDWSACAYCQYQGICGLDPKAADGARNLPEIGKEEFRALLANEGKTT